MTSNRRPQPAGFTGRLRPLFVRLLTPLGDERAEVIDLHRFDAMGSRAQRLAIIATAHELGIQHRRDGLSAWYLEPAPEIAERAADAAGLTISQRDASRWETAAAIAYRGAYDAVPEASPLQAAASGPEIIRRPRIPVRARQ